ncbi:MAG: acyl-CoA dehydrogenase family protein [Syntrophomonadaceae bacterium]|nr:acyl-CoA dehydrogenase family protein [Syntrophomonadaceae bacterium]
MNFDLSSEEAQIRDTVARFAEREIAPLVDQIDADDVLPEGIFQTLGGMGLLGLTLPEAYGGAGGNLMMEVLATEELSRVSPAVALSYGAHINLCVDNICRNGNEEQKRRYLPGLASGELVGAMALTEPNAGSDAVSIMTTARRDGDHYVLNGSKTFITNGPIADVLVVYAKTDKNRGPNGISAFIVEKGFPGYSVSRNLKKVGFRGSPTGELAFDDCRVPAANLLGQENQGVRVMMSGLDYERACFGSVGLGIAQGAFDLALKYSKERVQFGQAIASFQMIQSKLADMYTQIQAARLLVYWVTVQAQAGRRVHKEAAAAMLFAGEMCVKVAEEAVQIHGGYGLMLEYPVQRFYRDAKLATIGAGTSEIRRLIIARELLKE